MNRNTNKKKHFRTYCYFCILAALSMVLACTDTDCPLKVMGAPILIAGAPIGAGMGLLEAMENGGSTANLISETNKDIKIYADKNKDGKIDRAELEAFLTEAEYEKKDIDKIPQANSYIIKTKEFNVYKQIQILERKKKDEKIIVVILDCSDAGHITNKERITRYADKNNDGKIDRNEAEKLLLEIGGSKEEIKTALDNAPQQYYLIRIEGCIGKKFNYGPKWYEKAEPGKINYLWISYEPEVVNILKKIHESEQNAKYPPEKSKFGKGGKKEPKNEKENP